jgi:hypothetical protein
MPRIRLRYANGNLWGRDMMCSCVIRKMGLCGHLCSTSHVSGDGVDVTSRATHRPDVHVWLYEARFGIYISILKGKFLL